jgi:NAD(P)-dependent dehydrogenase (short-subunit alcohol dehydrogenase family)
MSGAGEWIGRSFGLSGKVAVVTGAAGGIGAASALALSRAGARVVAADLQRAHACSQSLVEQIAAEGGEAVACTVDVAVEAEVRRMIELAERSFGRLDILFNNAAAIYLLADDDEVASMDAALWDEVMAVNVRGVMLGCKYAVPAMLKTGGGSIINTSSGMSVAAGERNVAYATSKAAVDNLTRAVAARYGRRGIRCNAIQPGTTPHRGLPSDAVYQRVFDIHARHTLLGRLCRPEDQAAVVVFLASDAASMITGHILPVDGGLNVHLPTWADMRELAGIA